MKSKEWGVDRKGKMRYRITIKKKLTKDRSGLTRRNSIFEKIIEYRIIGLIIFGQLPAASADVWFILVIQITL